MVKHICWMERRALQILVAVGCIVPLAAGAAGVLLGPVMMDAAAAPALDSHYRYLSGLLLAIGIGFASTIPKIESQGARFRLLTLIVVVGGVGRAVSAAAVGFPHGAMAAALVMELVVTPGLALWQHRIARKCAIIPH